MNTPKIREHLVAYLINFLSPPPREIGTQTLPYLTLQLIYDTRTLKF